MLVRLMNYRWMASLKINTFTMNLNYFLQLSSGISLSLCVFYIVYPSPRPVAPDWSRQRLIGPFYPPPKKNIRCLQSRKPGLKRKVNRCRYDTDYLCIITYWDSRFCRAAWCIEIPTLASSLCCMRFCVFKTPVNIDWHVYKIRIFLRRGSFFSAWSEPQSAMSQLFGVFFSLVDSRHPPSVT